MLIMGERSDICGETVLRQWRLPYGGSANTHHPETGNRDKTETNLKLRQKL